MPTASDPGLATLHRLTVELARITASGEVATFVLNEGVRALGGSTGSLCLVAGEELEITAAVGYSDEVLGAYRRFAIDTTTPAGECAMLRSPIYCATLDELYDRYPVFRQGPIVGDPAIAVLPLEASDATLLGTMVIGFSASQAFTTAERWLLEGIAREASVALERARANEALIEARARMEEARDQLAFLAEASAKLAESLDLDETMRHVAQLAVPRISDACVLHLLVDGQTERHILSPTTDDAGEALLGEGASSIVYPLNARGHAFGSLEFADRAGRVFSPTERQLAEELVTRAAVAIDNSRLFTRELTIAETLQRALLPARLPIVPGVRFASRYVPGSDLEVGGDWYSAIAPGEDRFVFVVGDVSGRGLHAATTMASVRYTVRALAFEGNEPASVLEKCGTQLDLSETGRFVTVLVGRIDLTSRELILASAGHLSPLLLTDDGAEFLSITPGLPIGVVAGTTYSSVRLPIRSRSTLVAFTDGLVERRGESLDVGLERLRTFAVARRGDVDSLVSGLLDDLTAGEPSDDVAILGIQWELNEQPSPSSSSSAETTDQPFA